MTDAPRPQPPPPPTTLPPALLATLADVRRTRGRVVALTGAGVSAESGIPTFRGPDGYWTIGSENWRAQDLATLATFARLPAAIWGWYLWRRGRCLAAAPNAAHFALAALDAAAARGEAGESVLVTQNVDGLHRRAGHAGERLLEIHGNLDFARCRRGCPERVRLADDLGPGWPRDAVPTEPGLLARLHCARCGDWLRPHVLWFDECYDEAHFRADSAVAAVDGAALLLVVGTSGATSLPMQLVLRARRRGVPLVVVDPEDDGPFQAFAAGDPRGAFLRGPATAFVPALAAALGAG